MDQQPYCQFMVSFVQHPSQRLLSVPDSPGALCINEGASRILSLTVLRETVL